ncbi:hypothetical protein COP2_026859 [Malus domestica]
MTSIQEADSLGERGGKRKSPMGKEKSRGKAFNWRCLYRYKSPHDVDPENIKMSMFSYQKEDDRDYEGRGRGGRGQRSSRGRGRGGSC